MKFLSDIYNFLKKNVLDKTSLDERVGGVVSNVGNFFTQQFKPQKIASPIPEPPRYAPPPILDFKPISNIINNISLATNPQTRKTYFSGLASPVTQPLSDVYRRLQTNLKLLTTPETREKMLTVDKTGYGGYLPALLQPDVGQPEILQPIREFAGRKAIQFTDALQDLKQGKERFDSLDKISGALQMARGIGKIAGMVSPPGLASEAMMLSPSKTLKRLGSGIGGGITFNKTISEMYDYSDTKTKIPFIGDVDLLKTAGHMYGFTANPINQRLFSITEKVFPPATKGFWKWLGVTAARGGLENVLLNLPDLPKNSSIDDKVKFYINNFGYGSLAEVLVRGGFKGIGKIRSQIPEEAKKYIANVVDDIGNWVRRMNIKVKTYDGFEGPMWKYELSKTIKKISEKFPKIGLTVKETDDELVKNVSRAVKEGKITTEEGQAMLGVLKEKPPAKIKPSDIPEELKPLAENIKNMRKQDFLVQFNEALNSQNLTTRETAEKTLEAIKKHGFTINEFYDVAAGKKQTAIPKNISTIKDTIPKTRQERAAEIAAEQKMSNISEILKQKIERNEIGKTLKEESEFIKEPIIKTKISEIQKKYGLDKEKARLVKNIAEAMANSSKNFDEKRAIRGLANKIKTMSESEIKQMKKDADFNLIKIRDFWEKYKPSYIPEWKINEIEADKSLLKETPPEMTPQQKRTVGELGQEFRMKAQEPTQKPEITDVNIKPNIKSTDDAINLIKEIKSKEQVADSNEASTLLKNFIERGKQIKEFILYRANEVGLTKEQIVLAKERKIPLNEQQEAFMKEFDRITDALRETRESKGIGYQPFYMQHISEDSELGKLIKITSNEGGFYVPELALELGSAKKRTGKLTEYSTDFDRVFDQMIYEAGWHKYGDKIVLTPEQQVIKEGITKFVETNKKHIESGNLDKIKQNYDFIGLSEKAFGKTTGKKQTVKYKIPKLVEKGEFTTYQYVFDGLKLELGRQHPLIVALRNVRDSAEEFYTFVQNFDRPEKVKFEEIKPILEYLGITKKPFYNEALTRTAFEKARTKDKTIYLIDLKRKFFRKNLQNLLEELPKYRLSKSVRTYINKELNRVIAGDVFRNGLFNQIVDFVSSAHYKAHLWLNVKVGLQQKLESVKLPLTEDFETLAKAIGTRLKKGGKLLKEYGYSHLDFEKEFLGLNKIETAEEMLDKSLTKKIKKTPSKIGDFLTVAMEQSKNIDFAAVGEAKGLKLGLKGKELRDYVRDYVQTEAHLLHRFNTPSLYRLTKGFGPVLRLIAQYGQYTIKDTLRIVRAFTEEKNFRKGTGLLLSRLIGALTMGVITGKGLTIAKDSVFGIRASLGPAFETIKDAVMIGVQIRQEKEREAKDPTYKGDYAEIYGPERLKKLFIRNYVPFGTQALRTKSGIDLLTKGYDETAKGRIKYPAPEGLLDKIRAPIFGAYSTKEAQKYYKKDQPFIENILGLDTGKPIHHSLTEERSKYIKDLFAQGKTQEARDEINRDLKIQEINYNFRKTLTPQEEKIIQEFYPKYKKDLQGNDIITWDELARVAHKKWDNIDLVEKIAQKELQIVRETGKPINPFYVLPKELKSVVLRLQTLPVGDVYRKVLIEQNKHWLEPYWEVQQKYIDKMIELGYIKENPNQQIYNMFKFKPSEELQKKLDYYNTLPRGTRARKNFLAQNPDVLAYFQMISDFQDTQRFMLGLPTEKEVQEAGYTTKKVSRSGYSGYRGKKSSPYWDYINITQLRNILAPKSSNRKISDVLKQTKNVGKVDIKKIDNLLKRIKQIEKEIQSTNLKKLN